MCGGGGRGGGRGGGGMKQNSIMTSGMISHTVLSFKLQHIVYNYDISYATSTILLKCWAVLYAGQPVVVIAIGGSITSGGDVSESKEIWASRVFQWIKTTFPHDGHKFFNSAKNATPASLFAACLETHLPEEADLILFEVCTICTLPPPCL